MRKRSFSSMECAQYVLGFTWLRKYSLAACRSLSYWILPSGVYALRDALSWRYFGVPVWALVACTSCVLSDIVSFLGFVVG